MTSQISIQPGHYRNDVVVRTVIFDEIIADFIARNPEAQIINLGAGLDSRFWRVDNGRIRWFDLDMPDSIALRSKFFATSDRNQTIAQSMFETSWLTELNSDRPTLIVGEALFFYFPEELVRNLFAELYQNFPAAEIVFQSISPGIVGRKSSVPILRRTRAELKWGMRSARDLSAWNPNYQFINEWSLVDRFPNRWRWYRWGRIVPGLGSFLREVMKISHIKFVPSST